MNPRFHGRCAILVATLIVASMAAPSVSATPTVSAVSPATGSSDGGDLVTITGTGFNAPTVTFGDVPAWIQSSTSTSIIVIAPPHTAGAVDIVVKNAAGSPVSKANAFTYEAAAAPTLTSLDPTSGSTNGGAEITLTGTGFMPGATVHFGDELARSVVYTSAQELKATAPPATSGALDVVVRNPGGATTAAQTFTYTQDDDPQITDVLPPFAPASGGMHLTIAGSGFADPIVTFGATPGRVLETTATSLKVQAPAHSIGSAPVVVTNPSGASVSTPFEYRPDMQIVSIDPPTASSRGGAEITITGTGLSPARASFGGVESPGCTATSTGHIKCIAPPGTPGAKDVLVTNLNNGLSARITGALTYEQSPAPTIAGVIEISGDSNGGVEILIGGSGFASVAGHPPAVWLGDAEVPQDRLTAANSNEIYVQMPPRPGTEADTEVRVRVVNPDATSSPDVPCENGGAVDPGCFRYRKADPPTGLSVEPASGTSNGGQIVSIAGENIHHEATVTFGGVQATIHGHGTDGIQVRVPPIDHAAVTDSAIDVTVTNPDGQAATAGGSFTYTLSPPPTSQGISPVSGSADGGDVVTIQGSGYSELNKPHISVAGTTVPPEFIEILAPTELRFTTPGGAMGAADVTVQNPDGQSVTLENAFLYNPTSSPLIVQLSSPIVPATGMKVEVMGNGFHPDSPTLPSVVLDGTPVATATVLSSSILEFQLPPGEPGSKQLTLINPSGRESNALSIEYLPEVGRLEEIQPQATANENGGLGVNIMGSGLPVAGVSLRIGDALMPMDGTPSGTMIMGHIPAMTIPDDELRVGLAVADAFGQTTTLWSFKYTAAANPTCGSASPKTAGINPGTQISLTGTGFARGATVELHDEVYGSRTIKQVTVSATGLTFTAPSGSHGPVDIKIINPNGATCSLANAFGYVPSINPTLTEVTPSAGTLAGGEQITLTGLNFRAGATVKFGSVEAAATALTSTTISVTAPPREEAAVVDVHVVNPGGLTATLAEAYTYSTLPAPTITTISPATGPSLGGTTITVAGTGFLEGATISFGGAMASNVQVNEAGTSLTAVTPARSPGAADVVLVNPDGQATSKTDAFTYTASPPPAITGITPSAGPATGGTTITVTGTHFAPGATLRVGTLLATGITVNSAATQITATVPAGSGTQSITVRNPDAQEASITDAFTYWVPELIDVAQANADLMATVKITRSAPDNILEWDLDALSQPPTGVQIWRSTSPFELLVSLEGHDAWGPYTDAVVTPNARYLVTVYYAKTAEGGFVTDVLSAPGYESQEQALSSAATIISDDSRWGIPLWVIIALAATAAFVGITFALLRRRQRASPVSEGDDENGTGGEEAASPAPAQALENPVIKDSPGPAPEPATQADEWNPARTATSSAGASPSWRLDCPRCSHTFTAMGIKPLRTSCPQCGVPGTLT